MDGGTCKLSEKKGGGFALATKAFRTTSDEPVLVVAGMISVDRNNYCASCNTVRKGHTEEGRKSSVRSVSHDFWQCTD